MKMKKWMALALCACLCLGLAGCGKDGGVYVQSVRNLAGLGGIGAGDKFLGLVVSENVSEIKKDGEKTIEQLLVTEGQDVKEGDPLFSYDTEELQLALDKQMLELEQLHATIANLKDQIERLEIERATLGPNGKLQYTIQIQTMEVDLKEAEINVATKENEVEKSRELLENATVLAPVTGRVVSISENGTDQNGNPLPYITIQQIGSYKVKGVLGELQRGGLREGDRVTITSRTGGDKTWSGTVTLVDYESPSQGSDMDRYYGQSADEMTASSKYPFYVQLDSTEGLLLGQHLYLEKEQEAVGTGLEIGASFICFQEDGSPYVWAEKNGRLQKWKVALGEYNPMADTYPIMAGLTVEDYIAFPDEATCVEGASTTHDQPEQETAPAAEVP